MDRVVWFCSPITVMAPQISIIKANIFKAEKINLHGVIN